jgi:hypothetical protein
LENRRPPRIRPWGVCRVLRMDFDDCRTRYEGVRVRSCGWRLERSCGCRPGRCRRGHGSPHPARSRARSRSLRPRRPFVWGAVRQDLRRPLSRTGRPNRPARRATCRSVREPSKLSGILQRLPPHLCAVAVVGSTWRRTAGLPRRLCQLACGRPRHAASPLLVGSSVPRSARRVRRIPTSLAQARSFQNLGDRPLVIVNADRDADAGWLPLQHRMATLSTNSSHSACPIHMMRSSLMRPSHKRQARRSATLSARYGLL